MTGLLVACGGGGGEDSSGGSRSGVTIEQPLTAMALAVSPTEAVAFQASCKGSGAITYEWDPGNGSNPQRSSSETFFYSYAQEGEYLPRVTCRDAQGGLAISTRRPACRWPRPRTP